MNWRLIIAVVIAIATVLILFWRFRSSIRNDGGFHNWVKDPAYRERAEVEFARKQALTTPRAYSDAEIARLVRELLNPEDENYAKEQLSNAGHRAVPHLLRALREMPDLPNLPSGQHVLSEKPFERVVDILETLAPPEAVPELARFVSHPNDRVRKQVALTLARIGTDECIDPVVAALKDDDDYVRSYAMMGLGRCLDAGQGSPAFEQAMFEAIVPLLTREDRTVGGEAPACVLRIDRDRAIPILLDEHRFNQANSQLQYILKALDKFDVEVPTARIHSLMAAIEADIHTYPNDYVYGQCLKLLANQRDPGLEALCRRTIETSQRTIAELDASNAVGDKDPWSKEARRRRAQEHVAEDAAEALARLHGLHDVYEHVFKTVRDRGFEGLTAPQRTIYSIRILHDQVNNGGFAQYFVNSDSGTWEHAREGLREVSAPKRAQILADALALFGNQGPSHDRDRRHDQLSRLSESQDEMMEQCDSQWFRCSENIEVLMWLYAIKHKGHFGG